MSTLFFVLFKLIWAELRPGIWLAAGLGFILLISLMPAGDLPLRPS